jgi:hypothetical protein
MPCDPVELQSSIEDGSDTAFCGANDVPARNCPKVAGNAALPAWHIACPVLGQSMPIIEGKGPVNPIRTTTVAVLLASFLGVQPEPAQAEDQGRRDRQADRRDWREERRDRREDRWDRRQDRRDRRQDLREAYNEGYWDASRHYRQDDRRYRPRRLGRNDRIYRGSDNRYYCKRDDGTTGLIVGGIGGGVLGHIIAPGGSKTLGTIIGAGAGALLGRAIDDGDIVCR